MRIKILILLISLIFILGCVEEGANVVKVNSDSDLTDDSSNQTVLQEDDSATSSDNLDNTETTSSNDDSEAVETTADLAITNFYLTTINPASKEEFDVSFKIKNRGLESIKDFDYRIEIMQGDNVIRTKNYEYSKTLSSGESSSKISQTYSLDAGSYKVVVSVDTAEKYIEDDEQNNVEDILINVGVTNTASSSGSTVHDTPGTNDDSDSDETPEYGIVDGTCRDSDGGVEYETKGTCEDDMGNSIDDICIDVDEIWEWYCNMDDKCTHESHTCFCEDGVCID